MTVLRTFLRSSAVAALAAAGLAFAAGVVVTPGTNAGYMYFPSGITGTGGGSGTGPAETLQTCRVTPTNGSRTIVLSTRPWYGYTKPVTVYYKMVGGGSGAGHRPQLESAGGSSVILKNGSLVAVAPGMNAGGSRSPISGSFTITSADTLIFILGGGGGGSAYGTYLYARQICEDDGYGGTYCYNQWESYGTGVGGGGGAGYYGGGSGGYQADSLNGVPSQSRIAFGGTGTAGGAGFVAGSLYQGGGGGGPAGGGTASANGANVNFAYWTGWENAYYQAGGGGAFGRVGSPGASRSGYAPVCAPATGAQTMPPLATTFDLSSNAGQPGSSLGGLWDPSGGSCSMGGGGYGEIVLQYQAPTCDLIPQYNQN